MSDSYGREWASVSTASSAVAAPSTGICLRIRSARYTTTTAQANSTIDSNILLNGARPAATQRRAMYVVCASAPADKNTVAVEAIHPLFENRLAAENNSAVRYPARLRLKAHVIKPLLF